MIPLGLWSDVIHVQSGTILIVSVSHVGGN